ncbi:isochorismatase family protein [Fervidobacterium pennivorans subsp. shakshaketiis]|jgi:isochorismate hydrolase|uniref:Isochorismate hydrolase n=1 Tax=Fervidobacterium pennivorans (strain DSM 9078 / Ven5) TaxID=771875 RepID=H9UAX8_FERPD|nr:isochorismatase family protein [Fervidobacterium pennivorans]AFG34671.1 isochorismate hydrolase [Fervidobacterium pennivorans DSM 9078]QIV77979.1 isochorismatase family protein [Fervidobacterium pennivorans subsp. keratinolyticus]
MFYLERMRHPLKISKPAILVIDVQEYFFSESSPAFLRGSERVKENIRTFLKQIRQLSEELSVSTPVIATIHKGGSENMKRWWGNAVEDVWAKLAIEQELVDVVIYKDTYDAFYMTELGDILKAESVDQLIITGVMTHLCCETTARSGFIKGYEIVMVEDCLWDKDEWYHYASLKNLAHGFVVVSTSQEVIERLKLIK